MSGSINISGLLRNMLDEGFNTRDCIGEMIDDSLGAGAKNIRISLDTVNKQLIFSDDGCGMTKEKLREAHVLHSRTESSDFKHGRFGIGRKHGLSHFTQNKYPVKTISKSQDTNNEKIEMGVNEITINYSEAIKNNSLELNPHEVGVSSLEFWKDHSIDNLKKGTITIIRIADEILGEIVSSLKCSDPLKSFLLAFGIQYNQILKDGVKISFILDCKEMNVDAYDPLGLNIITSQNKTEIKINIFKDSISNEIRYIFINNGKSSYRKMNPSSGQYKNFTDSIPSTYKKIGEIILVGSYSTDWTALAN